MRRVHGTDAWPSPRPAVRARSAIRPCFPIADKSRRRAATLADATRVTLFRSPDLLGVGALADAVNRAKHGDVVTFAANQHINPTNICILRKTCVFCGYARLPKEEGAYRYTLEQVLAEAEAGARRADARVPHRRRARHAGGARVLRDDVPRAQARVPARAHQGADRGRDRAPRAHREDVVGGRAGRAARGRARHDARRRGRDVQRWRCANRSPTRSSAAPTTSACTAPRTGWASARTARCCTGTSRRIEDRVEHLHDAARPAGRDRRLPRLHPARLSPRRQRARADGSAARAARRPGSTTCGTSPSAGCSSTTSTTSRRTGSWCRRSCRRSRCTSA